MKLNPPERAELLKMQKANTGQVSRSKEIEKVEKEVYQTILENTRQGELTRAASFAGLTIRSDAHHSNALARLQVRGKIAYTGRGLKKEIK